MRKFSEIGFSIIILISSLAVLAFTSRYVIKAIEGLMEITGLGETSVGFALLSVITSLPELTVAFFAITEGSPSLSVGDLLGSNVFNIGIVVGILMLTSGFLRECPEGFHELADILMLSSIIPLILVALRVPEFVLGSGLLLIFVITVYREVRTKTLKPFPEEANEQKGGRTLLILLKILGGTVILVLAARFAVSASLEIAVSLAVAPIVVGALIVAFGTSLPELSLSLTALKRGRVRLASANAIGSNLTNLTLILGLVLLSSLFSPFRIDFALFAEIISFVLITSLIIWYHMTKGADCRLVGISLILTYIVFQVNAIMR